MRSFRTRLAAALLIFVATSSTSMTSAATAEQGPAAADAHAFLVQLNEQFKTHYVEPNATEWVAETDTTDDTPMLPARANERWLRWLSAKIEEAREFDQVLGIAPQNRAR